MRNGFKRELVDEVVEVVGNLLMGDLERLFELLVDPVVVEPTVFFATEVVYCKPILSANK